ncbi:hypothetical protein MKW92_038287 [Papaver armeniacum]|nr:hypothetical protein MKW92_038287 [Papaver armeniacum]
MKADGGASILIRMENLIVNSIKKKLEICAPHSRSLGRYSIHRVPERFHKMREPSAYKPVVVSIGPYHRTNQSLKATEELKLLYAHKLLTIRAGRESSNLYPRTVEEEERVEGETRTIKLDSSGTLVATQAWFGIVEDCVSSIRETETIIRKCYSEPVDLDSKEFVEMMIIDGLFIIKMLIRSTSLDYDIADDPLDGNDWLLLMVEQDMFLLENQIPLFVLQFLANIIFSAEELKHMSLNKAIHTFIITRNWQHILPPNRNLLLEEHCEDAKHLLDFLILLIQPPSLVDSASSLSSSWKTVQIPAKLKTSTVVKFTISQYSSLKLFIPTLFTKLKRTCTTDEETVNPSDTSSYFFYQKGSAQGSFLDINFSRTGILEIPPLCIFDETDPLLRNLIACEQSIWWTLLYNFICSPLLRKQGIISNCLGCDEVVSDMFNKLCVGISDGGDYYSTHINNINKFYKKRRHIWKATLKREYFKSPWAIVSVLAAVLLITLTIISTVFGVLSFVIHKS